MKDVKPALFVNDPAKEVVTKDLHQEQTLAETAVTAEASEDTANNAANTSAGEVGSSGIFTKENGDKASSFIKTNGSDAKDIAKVVSKTSESKTDLDKAKNVGKTVDAIESSMDGEGALSNLSTEQKGMIALAGDAASDSTQSIIIINGVQKEIDKGDKYSVSSITKTLNSLSESSGFELLDLDSELAFISMVTSQAMKWGIPEFADAAIQRMRDKKERERQEMEALKKASRQGDVASTDYWLNKVGSSRWRNIAEELLYNILRYYKKPKSTSDIDAGKALLNLLNKLDSSWDAGRNLSPYIDASKNALEVLQFTDRGKYAATQLQLGLKDDTVETIMKSTFPDLDPDLAEF